MNPKSLDQLSSLLIIGLNYIGDAVMSTALLEWLYNRYPQIKITYISGIKGANFVLEQDKRIHELISVPFTWNALRNAIKSSQLYPHEGALILVRSWIGAACTFGLPLSFKIGYNTELRRIFLTHALSYSSPSIKHNHFVTQFLNLLSPWEADTHDAPPRIIPTQSLEAIFKNNRRIPDTVHTAFRSNIPILGICPLTSRLTKNYPLHQWHQVIQALAKDNTILIFGSKNEAAICAQLAQPYSKQVINLAGLVDLQDTIGLIAHCTGFVSCDTGPMHIAAALAIPTVGIFGSTDPNVCGPYGASHCKLYHDVSCAPCNKNYCCHKPFLECLNSIQPAEVIDTVYEMIVKNRS